MTEKTKARQVAVEASTSNPAGTLQELIENKEIFRETDISIERNSNGVTIKSSTGSSATIPAASSSNAGILTGTDKYKLDSLPELGQLNAAFNQKVDKVAGHSLVPDTQIGKLTSLPTAPQLSVSLNQKVDKVTGKGLIDPAPEDGKEYARKNGSWVEVVGGGGGASALADLTDVDYGTPTDGQVLTYDAATQKSKFTDQAGGDVEEAPIDGKQYARKDAGWEEVAAGGGDVEEAPTDGKTYGRKDLTWVEVPSPSDAILDFGYDESNGSDKFLLNSDFPDDSKRYSGLVQLWGLPMRYVATPVIGYAGGAAFFGREIVYSTFYQGRVMTLGFMVLVDFWYGLGEAYLRSIRKSDMIPGIIGSLDNLEGDFSVDTASFYYENDFDSGLARLILSVPAGLNGQQLSVSEAVGAKVTLNLDILGFATVPVWPDFEDYGLKELIAGAPVYNGIDNSGFEYKLWFSQYPATIHLQTQNPNAHTLDISL